MSEILSLIHTKMKIQTNIDIESDRDAPFFSSNHAVHHMRELRRCCWSGAFQLLGSSRPLDIGTMCVAAIVGVVAAESANVDLDSVLAEQCRLER